MGTREMAVGRGRPGGRRHQKDSCFEYQSPVLELGRLQEHTGIFTSAHVTEAAPGLDVLSYVSLSRWSVGSTNTALPANVFSTPWSPV